MLEQMTTWPRYAIRDVSEGRRARRDVVYLVSYPKSGRTWVTFMIARLFARLHEIPLERPTIDLGRLKQVKPELPTVTVTHDDAQLVTEDGRRDDPRRLFVYGGRLRYRSNQVILLVRDPRDVVVSYFYQVTRRSHRPLCFPNMSAFIRDPTCGFLRIVRFLRIWHRNRHVPRELLLVRYEDLMTKGVETLERMVNFIGLTGHDRDMVREAYDFSSATNMRMLEIDGAIEGMNSFGTDSAALKVRRAKVGSYKDELTPDDLAYCNRLMRRLPREYGYTADHGV